MNEKGKWIRPIVSSGSVRFWSRERLIRQGQFIKCGDVWEIEGYSPSQFQYPNHTEDFVSTDFKYYKTLDNDELMKFLKERDVYLCLGLATPTPYDEIEYPQVIGLHTNPLAPFSSNYPD